MKVELYGPITVDVGGTHFECERLAPKSKHSAGVIVTPVFDAAASQRKRAAAMKAFQAAERATSRAVR